MGDMRGDFTYIDDIVKDMISHLGKKELLPMHPGDVYADISELERNFGFKPSTNLEKGLGKSVS